MTPQKSTKVTIYCGKIVKRLPELVLLKQGGTMAQHISFWNKDAMFHRTINAQGAIYFVKGEGVTTLKTTLESGVNE